jgi:hypothetical protein
LPASSADGAWPRERLLNRCYPRRYASFRPTSSRLAACRPHP